MQRLALVGVEHVVAPLGTSLTEAQAVLLKRYTNDVVLLYDSDGPGLKATFRAGDVLLTHGVRVRVATLRSGDDTDTLAQHGGAAAVEQVLHDAIDLLDRKLQLLEVKGWFGDVHKAREALDRLLPTLRAARDPVTRELYVSRVAERLGIPREAVAAEATRTAPAVRAPAPPPRRQELAERGTRSPRLPGAEIERKLLRLLLLHPEWLARARDEVEPDHLSVPAFRAIFAALLTLPPGAPIGDALPLLDERARAAWLQLIDGGFPGEGYSLDGEYAGALDALEEIRTFADIAAEADPTARRRRWTALSKEGQTRYSLYLRTTGARPRDEREAPPPEE